MRIITERSDQQGQAVIQMAIVLPILLVLLLSIWQLSVVYGTWRTLHDAASRGARAGAAAGYGHHQAAARAAARAAAGDVALKRVSLTATTSQGTAVYTATACSTYAVNLLGIVVKSGDICRDSTRPAE
jgi:Flp pilus assembly protein TadG